MKPADLSPAVRPTRVRYVVIAALCIAATVSYIQRNSYGGAETTIRSELHLTPAQTGNAVSFFFLSYALLQVPSGWLAQRAGPRLTLGCIAAGWSIALGLCAFAVNPATLIGGRVLMGVMQAGIFPCSTLVVVAWLPPTQRGTASALLNSFMLIGGALSSNLTGLLIEPLGWRGLFMAFAVPGLVWALLFLVWFRNRPADHPAVNDAELLVIETKDPGAGKAAPQHVPVRWTALLFSGALYLICFQQFFRAGANRFFDNWFTTYLQEGRGVGVGFANQLASLPQWLGVVGGLVGGALSDYLLVRTGSRRIARQALAAAALVACLVLYAFAYVIPDPTLATLTAAASFFIFSFSAPCAYALTMDMGGRNLGVVFGAMNMLGNFGAAAFTWAAPQLTDWVHVERPPAFAAGVVGMSASPLAQGPLVAAPNVLAGPPHDWTPTLILFFAMHVAALLCWLPLNPNGVIGERAAAPASKE
ncbi:MAG TPA: MFS transporter [Gemmataceae bacterium]|nr:MFS transporter [Gemmataceae bacterium]